MRIPLDSPPAPSTPFGVPDPNSAFGYHTGIDYPVAVGTPIKAPVTGTVFVQPDQQYNGNGIEVQADGKWYRMLHLSKYEVTAGTVKQGQLIGYSGNTGLSTGPHLHFDVRTVLTPHSINDFIDPLTLIGGDMFQGQSAEYWATAAANATGVAEVRATYVAQLCQAAGVNPDHPLEQADVTKAVANIDKLNQASGYVPVTEQLFRKK